MKKKHLITASVVILFVVGGLFAITRCSLCYMTIGDMLFSNNYPSLYNVEKAEYFFQKAAYLRHNNPYPFAHYQLSRTYFIQGKLREALFEANNELAHFPDHCRTYYIRGLTYGYMDELEDAIRDFTTFNDTCVKNSWAGHNDLAWFYFRKGDVTGMLTTIEKVAELYPKNPWVQNTYGLALLNSRRYKEAQIALTKAEESVNTMTPESWGNAYPGNNPEIYEKGLISMKNSIKENLELTKKYLK